MEIDLKGRIVKLITSQTLANEAAEKFAKQYARANLSSPHDRGKLEMLRQLKELPTNPNPEAVNRIIGNTSWTSPPSCSECGEMYPTAVVQLGQETDYESNTAWICAVCLRKAVELIKHA